MMDLYTDALRPFLFALSPEHAHALATRGLQTLEGLKLTKLVSKLCRVDDPILKTHCASLTFNNPLGLAAGFDKDADLPTVWPKLGFGFVELGTVTREAQPGNPSPRLFRLKADRAIINRMGFNNIGMHAFHERMTRFREIGLPPDIRYGINIGKSKVTPLEEAPEEYAELFQTLAPLSDYITINISSPNTPNLRKLQDKDALTDILSAVQIVNRKRHPLFLKIAPDLNHTQLEDILDLAFTHTISGLIATNTTLTRDGLKSTSHRDEAGGLSGAPLKQKSTSIIRFLAEKSEGKLPIIGVGGIETGSDAYEKIKAGASLVQLYTGFIYGGPFVVSRILRELATLLKRDGFETISDAVGVEREK